MQIPELKVGPRFFEYDYIYSVEDLPNFPSLKIARVSRGISGKSKFPRLHLLWWDTKDNLWRVQGYARPTRKWGKEVFRFDIFHWNGSDAYSAEIQVMTLEEAEQLLRTVGPTLLSEFAK